MPSGRLVTPEPGLPLYGFFVDGATHDENKAQHRPFWVRTPKASPSAPATSAIPTKTVNPMLIPMLSARCLGDFKWLKPLVPKTSATMNRSRKRLQSAKWVAPGIENVATSSSGFVRCGLPGRTFGRLPHPIKRIRTFAIRMRGGELRFKRAGRLAILKTMACSLRQT